jgi:hypothetical protein
VTTCILVEIKQHCERKFCLHIQDRRIIRSRNFEEDELKFAIIITGVAGSSITSVTFCQAAGRYVPEDSNIYAVPLLGSPTVTSRDFKEMTIKNI